MCSRYETPSRQTLGATFAQAAVTRDWERSEIWPVYEAPFIRRPPELGAGDEAVPPYQVDVGNFGLIPFWAKDDGIAKRTYNARSETVAEKLAFREAWERTNHLVIFVDQRFSKIFFTILILIAYLAFNTLSKYFPMDGFENIASTVVWARGSMLSNFTRYTKPGSDNDMRVISSSSSFKLLSFITINFDHSLHIFLSDVESM